MEKILILGSENIVGDWNKCETHYSLEDKEFISELWRKYYNGHESDIINSLYQMKIGELLPEVLPVMSEVLESIANKGNILDKDYYPIIKTFVLKALLDFSDKIKVEEEYHRSYENILNLLINCGDENAAVILDEYRTH